MNAGMGLLLGLGAAVGGYALYKAEEKRRNTAPTIGVPVPVYGPNGAIIGYATPSGIYPNQAPGGPTYTPPKTSTEGVIDGVIVSGCCGGCGAFDGGDCKCDDDYRRMQGLTNRMAFAGAFR